MPRGFGWLEFLTRHIGRILKQQRHVWRPQWRAIFTGRISPAYFLAI
jgi:hypothetical protein